VTKRTSEHGLKVPMPRIAKKKKTNSMMSNFPLTKKVSLGSKTAMMNKSKKMSSRKDSKDQRSRKITVKRGSSNSNKVSLLHSHYQRGARRIISL
jgi:hypothetical protein